MGFVRGHLPFGSSNATPRHTGHAGALQQRNLSRERKKPSGHCAFGFWRETSKALKTLAWKDVQVKSREPVVKLSIAGLLSKATPVFPLYQEVRIVADATDPDNDPLASFAWTLTLPDGSAIKGTPCPEPLAGSVLCFSPATPGTYTANLTVTDNLGTSSALSSLTFEVRPDQLPCVRDTESGGAGTLLRRWDEDVAFTVAVDDDGDPFPPHEGQTSNVRFVWLLGKKESGKPPSLALVTDYNQSSFRLPSQSFVQGDEIEVRVEVMDRTATPLPCQESEASCMSASANAPTGGSGQCSQRLTWTVRYVL